MMMKTITIFALISLLALSCRKFLDEKPDAKLSTPATLKDLSGLLDNYQQMNIQFPSGAEILGDNYYLSDEDWAAIFTEYQRNYYIWQKDDANISDWEIAYNNIYTCNLVLKSLASLDFPAAENELAANIKGAALFFRASYFYSLAQLFAVGYDPSTASEDPGIPLKLTTDFTQKTVRATIRQTYEQIISDFKNSVALLPVTPAIKSRPSRAAAYGSLARTYLSMQDYANAGLYADSCLQLVESLIDYNDLDPDAPYPFERFNKEVIFQALSSPVSILMPDRCKIDSALYNAYDDHDLRKVIFFTDNADGSKAFKGNYDGAGDNAGYCFTGITTDEQFLIKAECEARIGGITGALYYINTLLKNRMKAGYFEPLELEDPAKLLVVILSERRKELLFRGIRWTDLKRLNREVSFATTIYRNLNGVRYSLPPNDKRYVAQIPRVVIEKSNLQQNP